MNEQQQEKINGFEKRLATVRGCAAMIKVLDSLKRTDGHVAHLGLTVGPGEAVLELHQLVQIERVGLCGILAKALVDIQERALEDLGLKEVTADDTVEDVEIGLKQALALGLVEPVECSRDV